MFTIFKDFTFSAAHKDEDIARLARCMKDAGAAG